jgi:hypothetical protein
MARRASPSALTNAALANAVKLSQASNGLNVAFRAQALSNDLTQRLNAKPKIASDVHHSRESPPQLASSLIATRDTA